jgi:hypothetical protein
MEVESGLYSRILEVDTNQEEQKGEPTFNEVSKAQFQGPCQRGAADSVRAPEPHELLRPRADGSLPASDQAERRCSRSLSTITAVR